MVAHAYNPSTWQAEAKKLRDQGYRVKPFLDSNKKGIGYGFGVASLAVQLISFDRPQLQIRCNMSFKEIVGHI